MGGGRQGRGRVEGSEARRLCLWTMDGGRGLEKVWIKLVGYWPRESRREV
jgi:hypothetical protein